MLLEWIRLELPPMYLNFSSSVYSKREGNKLEKKEKQLLYLDFIEILYFTRFHIITSSKFK